jgi:hypothetical protein
MRSLFSDLTVLMYSDRFLPLLRELDVGLRGRHAGQRSCSRSSPASRSCSPSSGSTPS